MEHLLYESTVGGECTMCGMENLTSKLISYKHMHSMISYTYFIIINIVSQFVQYFLLDIQYHSLNEKNKPTFIKILFSGFFESLLEDVRMTIK